MTKKEEFLILYSLEGLIGAACRNKKDKVIRGQMQVVKSLAFSLGIPKDKLDLLEETVRQKVANERGE